MEEKKTEETLEPKKRQSFKEYVKGFISWNFVVMLLIFITGNVGTKLGTTPVTSFSVALGISGTVLGLLTSLQKVIQMCSRPVSGWMFDHLSKKRILAIGYGLTALCYLCYALTGNQTFFCVSKVMQGFSGGMLGGLAYSMLVKSMGVGKFGMAVAVIQAISNIFVGYGTVIAKKLFQGPGFRTAFLVAAAWMLIPAALTFLLRIDENQEQADKEQRAAKNAAEPKKGGIKNVLSAISWAALPICTLGLFANTTRELFSNYTVQLGVETGVDTAAGIAIAGVVTVWVGFVAGYLIDRISSDLVLVVSYALLGLSNFLYGSGHTVMVYTFAAIAYQIGIGAYWPALQTTCFKAVGKDRAGSVSQTLYMFLDIVALISASIIGVLYDAVGIVKVYTIFGFVNVFAIVYFFVIKKIYLDKYRASHGDQE